jgi:uncharacterized protein YcbK (DUF882 family)
MKRRFFLSATLGVFTPHLVQASARLIPLRRLRLINAHTGESFDGPFRDDVGPLPLAMADLSEFLRDHHSGEKIVYDIGVLDFLVSIMEAAGVTYATVLSAYRTPETNAMLARTTFGVAEHSQHMYGRALDVRLPNRNDEAVRAAREMKLGGVGWYPRSGFFHIDTGPVRNWTLDERGLDALLRAHQSANSNSDSQRVLAIHNKDMSMPGLENSGRPLDGLVNSGRPLRGRQTSGQPLASFKESGKPLVRPDRH